ncbi:hypothetical protein K2173_024835 [Erythroxylum novogranatense]|uniref:Uncharacterized protein n=1 Tax=Erythroxylum novogranatense TaxID=1862640 RepID=A0AAV8UCH8_9ROSI|nr:hypothetical protein K2173_024835 [Erythroxylum novogranatense]
MATGGNRVTPGATARRCQTRGGRLGHRSVRSPRRGGGTRRLLRHRGDINHQRTREGRRQGRENGRRRSRVTHRVGARLRGKPERAKKDQKGRRLKRGRARNENQGGHKGKRQKGGKGRVKVERSLKREGAQLNAIMDGKKYPARLTLGSMGLARSNQPTNAGVGHGLA